MKVVLISPAPPPYGGIANWTRMILRYNKENDNELDLININIAPKTRSTEGRTLYERIFGGGIEMIYHLKKLNIIAKKEKLEAIHLTTSGQFAIIRDILLLSLAKYKGIKTIYHIRFGRVSEIYKMNTIEWKLLQKAVALSNVTISLDSKTYSVLNSKFIDGKIVHLANPIDIEQLPKISYKKRKQVVFVGWVIKTKGIEELIRAWNEIGADYDGYTLLIIGPAEEQYKKKIQNMCKLDSIVFSGEKNHEDTIKEIAESEILVLPSYTEGFPNVIIESMALNTPVIGTDVGAIADILSLDCGIVIEPRNTKDLINSLRKLLNNEVLRDDIAKNASRKLISNYSLEVIYKKYKEIWVK